MQLEMIRDSKTVWIKESDLVEDGRTCRFSEVRGDDEEFDRKGWVEVYVLGEHKIFRRSTLKEYLVD